jgi:fermentation-respiration switch protein FrsA (DUF1100 family)
MVTPNLPARRPRLKGLIGPVLTVVTVVAVLLAVLYFAQRSLIYFPHGEVPAASAVGLPTAEVVRFETEDGLDLHAWFVPAREPPAGSAGSPTPLQAARTILVFNGNAGNRAFRARLAALFAEYGWSTLLVDYRGYGGNPGLPSEGGLERDARAALKYALSRPDVDARRIVFFGESLGAAVAIRLAVDYPPAALILRSPFSSLTDIGAHHYPLLPVRLVLKDRYASIDRVSKVQSPVLVIAGDADGIVPLQYSERLFAAANEPKRFVVIEDADHNDEALLTGPGVLKAIREFLR